MTTPSRAGLTLAALLACSLPGQAASALVAEQAVTAHEAAAATVRNPLPIRSRAALDVYLQANPARTPLDLLPFLARQRFLDSLRFGDSGLGGFDRTDLETELTADEIRRILSLFSLQSVATRLQPRYANTAPPWRGQAGGPGPVEQGYDTLYRLQRSGGGDPAAVRQRLDVLFADQLREANAIAKLSERELVYLLRSLALVAENDPRPGDVDRLRHVVGVMEDRGLARPGDFDSVHDGLLKTRQFENAKAYAAAHPDVPQLPDFVDSVGTAAPAISVWRASADESTLVRMPFDPASLQILVTAGCHFSRDAAVAISADPVLGPVFKQHAHWLMLPPGNEDPQAVREWNQQFPAAQATQIYRRDEWAFLPPDWSMPTFFIVRDGKVIDSVVGWPSDQNEARPPLVAALKRAGLLR